MLSGAAKSGTLQLYSVGHVNHTAIYLAIMLGALRGWLFARWRTLAAGHEGRGPRRDGARAGLARDHGEPRRGRRRADTLLILALAWWPRWRAPLVASLASHR